MTFMLEVIAWNNINKNFKVSTLIVAKRERQSPIHFSRRFYEVKISHYHAFIHSPVAQITIREKPTLYYLIGNRTDIDVEESTGNIYLLQTIRTCAYFQLVAKHKFEQAVTTVMIFKTEYSETNNVYLAVIFI